MSVRVSGGGGDEGVRGRERRDCRGEGEEEGKGERERRKGKGKGRGRLGGREKGREGEIERRRERKEGGDALIRPGSCRCELGKESRSLSVLLNE